MGSSSDVNLLTGVIALQNQLITHEQLIAALQAWFFEKQTPLAEHLVRLHSLTPEQRHNLELLVNANLQLHDNDPQKSMAEFSSLASSLATQMHQLGDAELTAFVTQWNQAHDESMSWDASKPPSGKPSSGTVRMGKAAEDLTPYDQRVVGRFKILKHHARGGLGEVWLAQDLELGREVAFKEIQDDKADYPQLRSRFVREAEVTSSLEHPGIVPIYGMGQFENGRPYYAMRFLDKKTLFHEIEQFHLDRVDPVLKLGATELNLRLRGLLQRFIDICEAMDYAHSRGVLHRDLKPQNIMIGRYGETLVVDWGLAKLLGKTPEAHELSEADPQQSALPTIATPVQSGEKESKDLTQLGREIGTVLYMSPEQAHGRHNELTPASDVFSLGAILYEILTGKTLYTGTYAQALAAAKEVNYQPPRRLNNQLTKPIEAICLKALAKDPSQRYTTAKLLAKDVESYLADEPVTAKRDTLWELAGRLTRRYRSAVLIGIASLLFITCGTIAASYLINDAKNAETSAKIKAWETQNEIDGIKHARSDMLKMRELFESPEDDMIFAHQEVIRRIVSAGRPKQDGGLGRDVKLIDAVNAILSEIKKTPNNTYSTQTDATMSNTVGQALLYFRQYDDAIHQFKIAYEIRSITLGKFHPHTLETMNYYAKAHRDKGDLETALSIYKSVLNNVKTKNGMDDDDTLISSINVAITYRELGKLQLALNLLKESLKLEEHKKKRDKKLCLQLQNEIDHTQAISNLPEKLLNLHLDVIAKRASFDYFEEDINKYIQNATIQVNVANAIHILKPDLTVKEHLDAAMYWLQRAANQGYMNADLLDRNDEFELLKNRDDYKVLLEKMREKPQAHSPQNNPRRQKIAAEDGTDTKIAPGTLFPFDTSPKGTLSR